MAYVLPSKSNTTVLSYLPEFEQLKSGKEVVFDYYKESDVPELYSIFQQILEEGQTYPQESVETVEDFRNYYLSHDTFVLRDKATSEVLGAFYVKPNYPGRSSHICNGGFIVKEVHRGQGIAKLLVTKFLRVGGDLGYQASVFNLVYVTNTASLKLWENFGFKQIGRVPNAGNLKGLGYTDAIVYYHEFTPINNNLN